MRYSSFSSASERGFTLLETIFAVSIFLIILGGLMGVYITFVHEHRRQIADQYLQTDIQRFLEVLDREVRTGYGNTFGSTSGTDAGDNFFLYNQNRRCVWYFLQDGKIIRQEDDGTKTDCSQNLVQTGDALTSKRTSIRRLVFSNIRTPQVDADGKTLIGQQGRVTVGILACPPSATTQDEATNVCLPVQTTITSRQYIPAPTSLP